MDTKNKAPAATEAKENSHANHSTSAPSAIGVFAKSIGKPPLKFFKQLKLDKFLDDRAIAFQCWIDRGIFIVVERPPVIADNGASFPRWQTLVTAAGREFLRKRYANGGES